MHDFCLFFACFLHAFLNPLVFGDRVFLFFFVHFLHEKRKHEKSRSRDIDDGFGTEVSDGKKKAMSTRCGLGLEAKLFAER